MMTNLISFEDRIGLLMQEARQKELGIKKSKVKPPPGQKLTNHKSCEDKYGNVYPSYKAFAAAYGISVSTVTAHIKLHGNLNLIKTKKPGPICKPITIRGVDYPSVEIAATKLGVLRNTIYRARWCGALDSVGTGSGGYREKKARENSTLS